MSAPALIERLQFIKGIDPVADAFDSTVYSDVVKVVPFSRVTFVLFIGVGATGTSTITIEACDDVVPTNTSPLPFLWREILSGDTEGAVASKPTTGVVTTAGSSKICIAEVREDLFGASEYAYVRLKAVESVNSPVLGSVLIIGEAKDPQAIKASAIV